MHIVGCLKYQRYVVKTRVIDKHLKNPSPIMPLPLTS